MKIYTFKHTQFLPITIDEAWPFFSTPKSLQKITPPEMGFEIISEFNDEEMYAGMIIHYKVKPLWNIPVQWVTEITHVEQKRLFVDEQRFGPYKFWHHQHIFEEKNGGVEMKDIVHYALPFGILGRLFQPILVQNKLNAIFAYRKHVLDEIFINSF